MNNQKIRVGVIGAGYVAVNNFLPILSRCEDVELVSLMAAHRDSAEKGRRLCGAEHATDDMREFLDSGLDCAFVLTPKQCHASQVSELLKAGIDVYCEKPMATTIQDASALADLAEKTGRKLMIGFNRRFAPVVRKARQVYADVSPDVIVGQKNRPATEYHATLENAIHIVDLMRFFGGEVRKVHAISKYSDPDYETFTTAMLEFENGSSGMLVADRSAGQWEEKIELHGSGKSVLINVPDSVSVTDADGVHTAEMTPLAMGWAKSEDKMGFTDAARYFLDCVRDNKKPSPDARDALKTHILLDRILREAGLPGMGD